MTNLDLLTIQRLAERGCTGAEALAYLVYRGLQAERIWWGESDSLAVTEPQPSDVAAIMGQSKRSAQAHRARLMDRGLIKRVRIRGREYRLEFPEIGGPND